MADKAFATPIRLFKASQQYQAYQTFNDGAKKPEKLIRFPANEDSDYQDGGFAIAFVIHLVVILAVIGWRFVADFGMSTNPKKMVASELSTGYLPAVFVALAFGFLASIVWTISVRSFAYTMLMITLAFNALLILACIVSAVMAKHFVYAGIFGLFLALYLLWVYCIWNRLAFTAQLISTSAQIMVQTPGTLFATFTSLIVSIVFSVVTLVGLVCLKLEVERNKKQLEGAHFPILIGLVFSTYWTSTVIANVLHMTICGVVGRWYFKAADLAHATRASLGRALGKSFGSVCFGSLIIAVLKTIRFLIDMGRSAADGENPVGEAILCVLDAIMGCIEDAVRFFNTYAYVYCAVYGMKFMEAGQQTWQLFTETGLDMILAFDLSGSLTVLGALLGGLLSALLTYATIHFTGDHIEMHGKGWLKPKDGELTPAYVIFAFLTGFVFVLISSTPIESGVTALLVCYAEEPDVLAKNYPELHKKFEEVNEECQKEGKEKSRSCC